MGKAFGWLWGLSVGTKIALTVGVLMLPIGHLTWLYIKQVNKEVAFSTLELDGAAALPELWAATAIATSDGARPEALDQAAGKLRKLAEEAGVRLNAKQQILDFEAALRDSKDPSKSWDAGPAAIQKIADGSNLTLDPDVDSYYMMDVATVRMPELAAARAALKSALGPYTGSAASLSVADFETLVQTSTRFDLALAAVQASLKSGTEGNTDGTVALALKSDRATFTASADRLSKLMQALRAAVVAGKTSIENRTAHAEAAAAVSRDGDLLWKSVHGELFRLLRARIDGFHGTAMRDLIIAALGALFAIGIGQVFARSIRIPIGAVVSTLRKHQSGDFSGEIAHVDLKNEIGEIARAIDRGKHAAERSALTLSAMNQSPTMLMITDPGENITFMSASLVELLMRLEPVFRETKNDFSVEKMTGQHLDYYRANPNLRRQLILDNGDVRKVRYDVGGEVILVDMAYIYSETKAKIGHTLVWRNVTAELQGQAEVAAVVEAAQHGDFSARLGLENKEGFVKEMAVGLNNVSALVEQATNDFATVMDAVAHGDLTHTVGAAYEGVLGSLKASINGTVSRLSDTVTTIQTTASDVAGAAREISDGARDLARRTEDQASSLEETAATTEELAASVKASAQSSREAVRIADEAMKIAENGGGVVHQAVDAMTRIEASSKRIADISTVIDSIAFQTNLLALNAAVEAARAGDAGKGFAVVASEVRSLAQRSADAAKDINQLIASSTREISEGVKLVKGTGEVLGRIVESSRRVSVTVSDIATASGEQSNGIDEMSQTVAHMDEMTHQNAALAEESAASAMALDAKIKDMNAVVASFRTTATANETSHRPENQVRSMQQRLQIHPALRAV